MAFMKDRKGQKQGRLTILEPTDRRGPGGNVIWKCICSCGKLCYIDSVHLNPDGQQSCGCDKINIHKRAIKTGPKSNRYIQDRDKVKNGNRAYGLCAEWRIAVYEADNYICQCCGNCNKINAHHLDNWIDFPRQRFDITNGITLCVECHKLFHKLYGRKHNVNYQFAEFLTRKV